MTSLEKKILKILLKAILNITLGAEGSESISILCPSVTSSAPSSSWAQTLCSPSGVLRLISLSCGCRERLYSKTQGQATLFPVVVWFGLVCLVGWGFLFVFVLLFCPAGTIIHSAVLQWSSGTYWVHLFNTPDTNESFYWRIFFLFLVFVVVICLFYSVWFHDIPLPIFRTFQVFEVS